MTSSCIRLVWQPIQHKDRQRAESGETDSWVAANRQGGPAHGGSNHTRPPSGMIASMTWLVGIVATTATYLALWVGLSAFPDPGWAAIPLACVLIAIIPFCTGLLSPSLVAIVIPLVGQVTGTLIFFSTPWFGCCCFSNLVYDSLMPLFVYFVGGPLFFVYLPFAVGRALR